MVKQTVFMKENSSLSFSLLCFSWKYSFSGCASHLLHRTGNVSVSMLYYCCWNYLEFLNGIVYKEEEKKKIKMKSLKVQFEWYFFINNNDL